MARPSTTDPREYRRGVVLGLTFAEVLLLLVFLLLLAAAAVHERTRRELERARPAAEALAGAGLPLDDPAALARRLEEGTRAREALPALREELAELRARLAARLAQERQAEELAVALERSEAARRELAETLEATRRELERARPAAEALAGAGLPLDDPAALARRLEEGARAREALPALREELAELRARLAARLAQERQAEELAVALERSEAARRELAETLEATRRELERARPAAEALAGAGLPLDDPAALARRLEEGTRAREALPALREELAELRARLAARLAQERQAEELAVALERSEAARRELAETLEATRRALADTRRELRELSASHAAAIARAAELAADLALLEAQRPDPDGAAEIGQLRRRIGELQDALARAENDREQARARAETIERTAVGQFERLLQKGRELEARIAELEAERDALRGRLGEEGRSFDRELARRMIAGGVYPSCWEEDGKPVYVFEIALRLAGRIVVTDLAPDRLRRGEPWASVAPFRRGEPIDVGGFVAATRALADWSRRQDPPCRFWIRVRRELPVTAPTSEYLRVVGPLGSAATDHLPFYRVGG